MRFFIVTLLFPVLSYGQFIERLELKRAASKVIEEVFPAVKISGNDTLRLKKKGYLKSVYELDKQNAVSSLTVFDEEAKLLEEYKYELLEAGSQLHKIIHYKPQGFVSGIREYKYRGDEMFEKLEISFQFTGLDTVLYKYRQISPKTRICDISGERIPECTKYELYDDAGRLIIDSIVHKLWENLNLVSHYSYNTVGLVEQKETYCYSLVQKEYVFTHSENYEYNHMGYLSKKTTSFANGNSLTTNYFYKYNSHGDWLESYEQVYGIVKNFATRHIIY